MFVVVIIEFVNLFDLLLFKFYIAKIRLYFETCKHFSK
nr:MAG TPA: hypothetical protein [Caudoviricetes sp.]